MFRARAVNTLGVRGAWCVQRLHVPGVPLVDTDQLAPGSVTDVIQGDLDTDVYGAGYTSPIPGAVEVTPDFDCRLLITSSGSLQATNSTGSSGVIRTGVAVGLEGVGSIGGGLAERRSIANGETWQRGVVCTMSFDAEAGETYTFGMWYSDHVSATISSELTGIQTRVEVIKR